MKWFITNDQELQSCLGDMRNIFRKEKYIELTAKAGKVRSLDQNALSHAWYEQISRELPEDTAIGWKCYCKLHHGIPILRMDDEEFRNFYDAGIKGLTYEQKLSAMKYMPVTSIMNKAQLSVYLQEVQTDFLKRGVQLEFPDEQLLFTTGSVR